MKLLLRKGKTYQQVRDALAMAGLQIDNNGLSALSKEVKAEQG